MSRHRHTQLHSSVFSSCPICTASPALEPPQHGYNSCSRLPPTAATTSGKYASSTTSTNTFITPNITVVPSSDSDNCRHSRPRPLPPVVTRLRNPLHRSYFPLPGAFRLPCLCIIAAIIFIFIQPPLALAQTLSDDGSFYCSMPLSNLAMSYCGGDYLSRTSADLGPPDDKLYTMLDKRALEATRALVNSYGCNEEQCKGMICAAVFPVCDLSSTYTFPVCRFTCRECALTCRDRILPNVTLSPGIDTSSIVKGDFSCSDLPDPKAFACSSDAEALHLRASTLFIMFTAIMLLLIATMAS